MPKIDQFLAKEKPLGMTRFGVNLAIDIEDDELKEVGSPKDWNWDRIVDKGIEGSAFTNVEVRAVTIESKFILNAEGEIVQETIYSVEDKLSPLPGELEESFNTILGFARDYISDSYEKYGGTKEQLITDLTDMLAVQNFGREHFNNETIGDDHLPTYITELSEELAKPAEIHS